MNWNAEAAMLSRRMMVAAYGDVNEESDSDGDQQGAAASAAGSAYSHQHHQHHHTHHTAQPPAPPSSSSASSSFASTQRRAPPGPPASPAAPRAPYAQGHAAAVAAASEDRPKTPRFLRSVRQAAAPLPPPLSLEPAQQQDWQQRFDNNGYCYWVNMATGMSQWEAPPHVMQASAAAAAAAAAAAGQGPGQGPGRGQGQPPPPQPGTAAAAAPASAAGATGATASPPPPPPPAAARGQQQQQQQQEEEEEDYTDWDHLQGRHHRLSSLGISPWHLTQEPLHAEAVQAPGGGYGYGAGAGAAAAAAGAGAGAGAATAPPLANSYQPPPPPAAAAAAAAAGAGQGPPSANVNMQLESRDTVPPLPAPVRRRVAAHIRSVSEDHSATNPMKEIRRGQYMLIDYARTHFWQPPPGTRGQPMDQLICWSVAKLKHPLTRVPAGESTDGFTSISQQMFKNVTSYAGDRKSSKKEYGHVHKLITYGLTQSAAVRDELFAILCKQTNNNANPKSYLATWKLLAIICGCFAPSKTLQPYLLCHILEAKKSGAGTEVGTFARLAEKQIVATLRNGDRLQVPTQVEVNALESARPVTIDIETLDSQVKFPVNCYGQTTVADVLRTVQVAIGVLDLEKANGGSGSVSDREFSHFSLSQFMYINGNHHQSKPLKPTSRMLDVLSFWADALVELKAKRNKSVIQFKVILKVHWFLRSDTLALAGTILHLYWAQAVLEFRAGIYTCTEKEAKYLVALQLATDAVPDSDVADKMDKYFPSFLVPTKKRKKKEKAALAAELIALTSKLPPRMDKSARKVHFISYVSQWRHFGWSTFPCKAIPFEGAARQSNGQNHDAINLLGINEHGLFDCDVQTGAYSEVASLDRILQYQTSGNGTIFKCLISPIGAGVVGGAGAVALSQSYPFAVETPDAEDIVNLLGLYKMNQRMSAASSKQRRSMIPLGQARAMMKAHQLQQFDAQRGAGAGGGQAPPAGPRHSMIPQHGRTAGAAAGGRPAAALRPSANWSRPGPPRAPPTGGGGPPPPAPGPGGLRRAAPPAPPGGRSNDARPSRARSAFPSSAPSDEWRRQHRPPPPH